MKPDIVHSQKGGPSARSTAEGILFLSSVFPISCISYSYLIPTPFLLGKRRGHAPNGKDYCEKRFVPTLHTRTEESVALERKLPLPPSFLPSVGPVPPVPAQLLKEQRAAPVK